MALPIHRGRALDGGFQIVNPGDLVRRVLDVTGVLAMLSNDKDA